MNQRPYAATGLKDNHLQNNPAFGFSTTFQIEGDYPNQEPQKINKELAIKPILVQESKPESFFQTDSLPLVYLGI